MRETKEFSVFILENQCQTLILFVQMIHARWNFLQETWTINKTSKINTTTEALTTITITRIITDRESGPFWSHEAKSNFWASNLLPKSAGIRP